MASSTAHCQIAAYFGDDRKSIIGRLGRVRRNAFARGALTAAPTSSSAAAASALAFVRRSRFIAANEVPAIRRALLHTRLDEPLALLVDLFCNERWFVNDRSEVVLGRRRRFEFSLRAGRRLPALYRVVVCASKRVVGVDRHSDAEPPFEIPKIRALLIEDVERNGRPGADNEIVSSSF